VFWRWPLEISAKISGNPTEDFCSNLQFLEANAIKVLQIMPRPLFLPNPY
jgi:hypothetical protein